MSNKDFLTAILKELNDYVTRRYQNNNGRISLKEIEVEAIALLTVNVLISQKEVGVVHQNTMEFLFNGVEYALKNLCQDQYDPEILIRVKNGYQKLMASDDVKSRVNNHFNELFSTNARYV